MSVMRCYSGVCFLLTDELATALTLRIKKEYKETGESETYKNLHLDKYLTYASIEDFLESFEDWGASNELFEAIRDYTSVSKLFSDEDSAVMYKIYEDGSIRWFDSDTLEYDIYFYSVPYNQPDDFNVFRPLFNSLAEIIEKVRKELSFIPEDYDIKKNIVWMDWYEGY